MSEQLSGFEGTLTGTWERYPPVPTVPLGFCGAPHRGADLKWGMLSVGPATSLWLLRSRNSGCSSRGGSEGLGTGHMYVLSACWENMAAFRRKQIKPLSDYMG